MTADSCLGGTSRAGACVLVLLLGCCCVPLAAGQDVSAAATPTAAPPPAVAAGGSATVAPSVIVAPDVPTVCDDSGVECLRDRECCTGRECFRPRRSAGYCRAPSPDYTKYYVIVGAVPLLCALCCVCAFRFRHCCVSKEEMEERRRRIRREDEDRERRERVRAGARSSFPDDLEDASVASTPPYGGITQEAPCHMVCPISLSVMKNPYTCADGCHNFERNFLMRHLRKNTQCCPVSRVPMTKEDATPNKALRREIKAWLRENVGDGFVTDSGSDGGGGGDADGATGEASPAKIGVDVPAAATATGAATGAAAPETRSVVFDTDK